MQRFAIGSYTSKQGHAPDARGSGLSIISLTAPEASAQMVGLGGCLELENPAYLAWNPTSQRLYTACEAGTDPGRVDVFSLDDDGIPRHISSTNGIGHDACHISLSHDGKALYTASYGGGKIAAFNIAQDGTPRFSDNISYTGNGANITRQEAPHAHQILPSPYSDRLYVCDLGTDTVWKHPFNFLAEKAPEVALKLPAGYGPRHLAFDPAQPFVYILCELIPRIIVAEIDHQDGRLEIQQDISSVGEGFASSPDPTPAAIKVHPSGRTLAVSNRFRDTVSIFWIIRQDNGTQLKFTSEFACGGKTPRDIEFNKDGSLLLVANQDSHNISSLIFNPKNGQSSGEKGPGMEIGSPTCIVCL